ncbi:SdiA-regulated domain-containing protein [Leeuwenhoekiella sp. MAR_2009_132]|uniref:SdiA-regulated domain-containing protein n=1 Tax=Leeuwenhoekiella sp. MAR_2009_132 TaxID=1392489 RepID=UPI00048FB537|nr:SdiA-regulated domain-containing protein [Leeuwenhoekiella sp. MAR_2009_132]
MNYLKYISLVLAIVVFSAYYNPQQLSENVKKHDLTIVNSWELPDALREVSGIDWIGDDKLAAIEDEDGIIYIYDLKAKKITKEIEFADDGDYEGIAVNGKNAYVMRSDGLLFEALNYQSDQIITKTYQSKMSHKNNVETLALDAKNNRLLTAPKDEDPNDENIKGVYAFDLKGQAMLSDLIFKVDMKDKALKDYEEKKSYKTFRPSDLAVHPKTGELYVLEGVNPKLLIMNKNGDIKNVFKLDKDDFAQPEGITFSPDGRLFISNEAHGKMATILEVRLNE